MQSPQQHPPQRRYSGETMPAVVDDLSNHFRPVSELKPSQPVIAVSRVSTQQQQDNLPDQRDRLRQAAQQGAFAIVSELAYVGSGKDPNLVPALIAAIEYEETHPGERVAFLFETSDRAIRPPSYHGELDQTSRLRERDVRLLHHLTGYRALFTLASPTNSPAENRSIQSKRGQAAKGNTGGRPIKGRTAFRERWLPLALELKRQGKSLREIAREIHRLSQRTISAEALRKWFKLSTFAS